MKHIFLWILGLLGFLAVVWYFLTRSGASGSSLGTVQTTGTQTTQAPWFPAWNGFTAQATQNVGASVSSAFSRLFSLSNNFGVNDGGRNPGVSISGSQVGGINSSGSGAGTPNDIGQDLGMQTSTSDQTSDSPLNGYGDDDFASYGGFDDSFDS
jgi:hypothetical protein